MKPKVEYVPEAKRASENKDMAERVSKAESSNDVKELESLRLELSDKVSRINIALQNNKAEMMEERSALIEEGVAPKDAQQRASAITDHGWRGRAHASKTIAERQLARVNRRIKDLNVVANKFSKKALIYRGTIDEIATQIQDALDAGIEFHAMASIEDAVVAVVREPVLYGKHGDR